MARGGDRFITLARGQDTTDIQSTMVDILARFIGSNSPVDSRVEGRVTVE
jgi:hypothetical protein